MRVDPHILTQARKRLITSGEVNHYRDRHGVHWFHLPGLDPALRTARLAELEPLHTETGKESFNKRVGQALEIAVFKALRSQTRLPFAGHYFDLDAHSDDRSYRKEEPPSAFSGRSIADGSKLDFLVTTSFPGPVGIEVKNIREWIYPDRREILDLLYKCCSLDAVPVLIARRIPFVTFRLLNPSGALIHQVYNQYYPSADADLAEKVRDKQLLGYHDVRVGNEPDSRLTRFIVDNLPDLIPTAREKFDRFKDLLQAFATGEMQYKVFAYKVRRRQQGLPEEFEPPADELLDYYDE